MHLRCHHYHLVFLIQKISVYIDLNSLKFAFIVFLQTGLYVIFYVCSLFYEIAQWDQCHGGEKKQCSTDGYQCLCAFDANLIIHPMCYDYT